MQLFNVSTTFILLAVTDLVTRKNKKNKNYKHIGICSDVDEYGFKREPNFDYASYENIMSNYYTTLTKRRMKWDKFLKTKPNLHNNKSAKLRRYIRKGIPGEF